MKQLFTQAQLEKSSALDKLPFECELCNKIFYIESKWIKSFLKNKNSISSKQERYKFCSRNCWKQSIVRLIDDSCGECFKPIKITPSQKKRSKSGKSFCSQSCAALYNNAHKTKGNKRSKLEIWLEEQLKINFPTIEIFFNKKEAINSELDIYIPSLNLAFELNGIFHYEPIFGEDKLLSIINNDNRKFQACLEKKIELVIIDSSTMKNFKPIKAQKYLDIVYDIINNKLL